MSVKCFYLWQMKIVWSKKKWRSLLVLELPLRCYMRLVAKKIVYNDKFLTRIIHIMHWWFVFITEENFKWYVTPSFNESSGQIYELTQKSWTIRNAQACFYKSLEYDKIQNIFSSNFLSDTNKCKEILKASLKSNSLNIIVSFWCE